MSCACGGNATESNLYIGPSIPTDEKYVPSPCAACSVVIDAARLTANPTDIIVVLLEG